MLALAGARLGRPVVVRSGSAVLAAPCWFVAWWRAYGRALRAEGLDVPRVDLGPSLARRERRRLPVQFTAQPVQALVPAGRGPGRGAPLGQDVQQRQRAAVAGLGQLEPQHVGAPPELQQRGRLAP